MYIYIYIFFFFSNSFFFEAFAWRMTRAYINGIVFVLTFEALGSGCQTLSKSYR